MEQPDIVQYDAKEFQDYMRESLESLNFGQKLDNMKMSSSIELNKDVNNFNDTNRTVIIDES